MSLAPLDPLHRIFRVARVMTASIGYLNGVAELFGVALTGLLACFSG